MCLRFPNNPNLGCLSHVPAGHLRDDGEPGAFWAFLNSQSTQAATQLG